MASTGTSSKHESDSEGSNSTELLCSSLNGESGRKNYNSIVVDTSAELSSSGSVLVTSQVVDAEVIQAPESTRNNCSCYWQKAGVLEHVVYFCALAIASYAGVVIRIYLSKIAQWNGVPLFPSFSAELVGTVIMGFIGAHQKSLASSHKALYQSIATGLCGSITTFSSWNSEAIQVLLQIDQDRPDNVTRIIGWITTLILGVGMPAGALLFGRHLSLLSPWSDHWQEGGNAVENHSKFFIMLEGISFFLLWVLLTCLIVALPYHFSRLDLMFSIIFASFGTYVRWHLAPLNSLFKNFKLGTFIVNVGGAWILGAMFIAKRHYSNQLGASHLVVQVLSGVATGFCGCLTTVSTFAVELTSLSLAWSYVYAVSSILSAQFGLIIVVGVYEWTR